MRDLPRLHFQGREPMALPNLGRALRDPEAHFPSSVLELPLAQSRAGLTRVLYVAEPKTATDILLPRDGTQMRSRLQDRMLGLTYGENMLRGDQAGWRQQRREIAQPMNAMRALAMAPRVVLAVDRIIAEWSALPMGEPPDLMRDMRRLALDALWRGLFSTSEQAVVANPMIDAAARAIDSLGHPPLVDHLALLREPARHGIANDRPDDAGKLAVDALANLNTATLLLHAGHDNVTAALVWALWLIAVRPDIQQRVRKEWRARSGLGDTASFSLAHYSFIAAVIQETLRLYPPILHLIRDVGTDLLIGEQTVSAGATAIIGIYAMHRHRLWWDSPDEFMPDRFLGEIPEPSRNAIWLAFGAGPRGCIGSIFAQVEMVLAIGMIVDRFDLTPNPAARMHYHVDFVLRPEGRHAILARALTGSDAPSA